MLKKTSKNIASEMIVRLRLRFILDFLPFLFVFIASLYFPIDPDLGWHLKYGEYFLKYGGVLRDNPFSQLMPDYKWVNTSWMTDPISYFIFHNFGFVGLVILGALVITFTFYFFSKAARLSFFEESLIFPLLVYFIYPVNSVSFRGQLLNLMFLGVLFYLLSIYRENKKIIYILPFVFLVWSGIDGEFLGGLLLFLGWVVVKLIADHFLLKIKSHEISKEAKLLVLIFFLSAFATLVNPFGIGIYKEVLRYLINPDLKLIAEYLPFNDLSTPWWNLVAVLVLAFWGMIILFAENKLVRKIPETSIFLVTYALSLSVRRYAWMMYYLSIPLLKPLVHFLEPNQKKYQYISGSLILLVIGIPIAYFKLPLSQYYNFSWSKYCTYYYCSEKAADFIIKNDLEEKKLFTLYNWGGWLIWNYPKIKPTIDGRMHLWRDKNGYSAFDQYYAIEQNITDIDKTKYNAAYMSFEKPVYNRLIELVKEGKWKLVYYNKYSGIFVKNF